MEELIKLENCDELQLISVSQKRLRLLAAQLHDFKMDWNDLDCSLLRESTETDQFTALLNEIDSSLTYNGSELMAFNDYEENGPETEFDADFVDKIRAMFDIIQRKDEERVNERSNSCSTDHSKISVLLDFFRMRRMEKKQNHEADIQAKVAADNQSRHNMTREFSQMAHESMEQANDACRLFQIQMLKDDLDTDRRLQELQNQLTSSRNEMDAALAASE